MVVRPDDTPDTLAQRRGAHAAELAAIAAAPVRHVPEAFLRAVEGLFPELVPAPRPRRTEAR